jgi:hypothetical protein
MRIFPPTWFQMGATPFRPFPMYLRLESVVRLRVPIVPASVPSANHRRMLMLMLDMLQGLTRLVKFSASTSLLCTPTLFLVTPNSWVVGLADTEEHRKCRTILVQLGERVIIRSLQPQARYFLYLECSSVHLARNEHSVTKTYWFS